MDETLERTLAQDPDEPGIPIDDAFRLMADATPVMIWASGADSLLYFFNTGWLSFTGRTQEEELGNGWTENVHSLDLHRCLDTYLSAFASRIPFKIEYRLRHHSGAYHWITASGRPHFDAGGFFTGYIGSCVDVHDIVELEERKDEFINAASHELKTPLTTLNVYLHILKEHFTPAENAAVQLYLDKMGQQVDRMTRLIADLLDLSKIQSGVLEVSRERVSLQSLWTEVLENYGYLAPHHRLVLHPAPDASVTGDAERLSQVLINLLSNAVKYSPHNSTIEVAMDLLPGQVLTRVTDRGMGIDKAHHRRLFERFYRVTREPQQTFPGLGIGLYICAQIIQQHQGSIWVESEPGQGAQFCFTLPLFPENN